MIRPIITPSVSTELVWTEHLPFCDFTCYLQCKIQNKHRKAKYRSWSCQDVPVITQLLQSHDVDVTMVYALFVCLANHSCSYARLCDKRVT